LASGVSLPFDPQQMPHDAFISYSTHDKAAADATCAALEGSGIRCWIAPRDIMPGAEWGEAIIDGINGCRVVILIFSANANESPQIRREIERAVNKGVPIIPLRIQDIAPTRSLEYFIGTVHWLDALTPPLESHLRRLVETVKALLQIDPAPPRLAAPRGVSGVAAPRIGANSRTAVAVALAVLGIVAIAAGIWWFAPAKAPPPQAAGTAPPQSATPPQAQAALPQPTQPQPPAPAAAKPTVDPILVGTFAHDSVIDDYDWRFVYSITAEGAYRLVTTVEEDGTYQSGNGRYRTINKRGRVRTGTYRAVGNGAIEVKGATVAAIFYPTQPAGPINPANPVMLGTWRAATVQSGVTWTLTIENRPDGTYHYQGRAEDNGTCAASDQHWRTTSAVTAQSNAGAYRVVDARDVEITGTSGPVIWQRQ
jgi:TIR domain